MKEKYIRTVIFDVQIKLDAMFSDFDDPQEDFKKDEIIEAHIRQMMGDIDELLKDINGTGKTDGTD